MTKEEEIRMINEKLDFYVMEASDEESVPLEKVCGKKYIREVYKSLRKESKVVQTKKQY